MRRKLLYITFLIFCIIGIIGCSKEGSVTKTSPNIREQVIGTLQDDVHRILGEPSGKLSGFSGEIYTFDNGTQMVFYYDNQMKVEKVKINDKDGTNTLSIEQQITANSAQRHWNKDCGKRLNYMYNQALCLTGVAYFKDDIQGVFPAVSESPVIAIAGSVETAGTGTSPNFYHNLNKMVKP